MADSNPASFLKLILNIISLIINILLLIWLFKVRNNAKEEPVDRSLYVQQDIFETVYTVGDFCYDHYNPYITNGAFQEFNIKMKNIRKYSTALLILFFISVVLSILSLFIAVLYKTCCSSHEKCVSILLTIIFFGNVIICILSLVFFIILSVNYFRSHFDDFKDFSKCKYLNNAFKADYNFVFVVKDNYIKFFVLYLISIFLLCLENCISIICKKKK